MRYVGGVCALRLCSEKLLQEGWGGMEGLGNGTEVGHTTISSVLHAFSNWSSLLTHRLLHSSVRQTWSESQKGTSFTLQA